MRYNRWQMAVYVVGLFWVGSVIFHLDPVLSMAAGMTLATVNDIRGKT